jgi:hypothetical protein
LRHLAELQGRVQTTQEYLEAERKRQEYKLSLEEQIRERKAREMSEKRKQEEIERKEMMEMMKYNPWGRPGCGAPLSKSPNKDDIPAGPFITITNVCSILTLLTR